MSYEKKRVGGGLFLAAFTLIIVATLTTFSFVIRSDISNLGGMYDIYRYYAPLTFFIDACIHAGEFPFWNPLSYCGLPNVGNPQSFLLYPPNLIRSLLVMSPTPERTNVSLAVMMGMHFIFMALCTYLLGRAHRLSFAGAMTAAIAFPFSALIVRRMCEYHFITTMAWLPLLLLLIKKAIDTDDFVKKMGIAICAGMTLGLGILGGFLQIINLMGLVAGLYGLFYFLLFRCSNVSDQGWRQFLRLCLHNGVAMAAIFILGSCLAAVLLLPAWELGSYTLRTSGIPARKYSDLWKWSPLGFYQSLVVYAGMKYEAETIRNSGVVALLLAFAALTHPRRRDVFMFLGMFLILFECCFGPPLPIGALLEKLTPFSMSAYSRAYDFGLLPLSLLAGFGVDAIVRPMRSKGHSLARAVMLLLIAYICIAPLDEWLANIRFISVSNHVRTIPILGIVLMLIAGAVPLPKFLRVAVSLMLLALLFGETFAWNQHYVPYMARRKVRDHCEIKRENVVIPTSNFRETDPICNRFLYSLRFSMNGVDPMNISAVRDIISGPPRDKHPFRGVQNWEPTRENLRGNMIFKRSFWLARQYVVGPLPGKREYYPSATTVFLEKEAPAPMRKVERNALRRSSISENFLEFNITEPHSLFAPVTGKQTRRLEFTVSLPKKLENMPAGSAGAVHSALILGYISDTKAQVDTWIEEVGTDRSEHGIRLNIGATGTRVRNAEVPLPDIPEMNIRITVTNNDDGEFKFTDLKVRSDKLDEDGLIQILARTANTVDLQIGPLDEHRLLCFLDADYPGWLAYVNGEPTEILRANEQFKAVLLAPGTHRVSFVFSPTLFWQSLYFSASVLVLALLLLMICLLKRSRETKEPDRPVPTPAEEPISPGYQCSDPSGGIHDGHASEPNPEQQGCMPHDSD
ncbi:MAG TPA: hypothetical protein ENN29_11625 [Candidatus Hydrogenedentes bacterium]|nr:hypothetical protein [Candidatus Hydrogenedentota bacterium]